MILTLLQRIPDNVWRHLAITTGGDDKLLLSGLACKKIGSHHSHLHNKIKAKETENQQLLLEPSEY